MERIGVIGLGRMGSAMAARYAAEGVPVTGWTRSGRTVEGVPAATDLATLAAASDVLVLSLFDDAAVAETLDALMALDLKGKLIIETSTVVPGVVKTRVGSIHGAHAAVVDAPIAGGPELVAAGQCGIFIGGDADAATRAQTALAPLSSRVFHVGPIGAGMVMKTINNSMLQVYVTGLRELLPLARRAGLPLETALTILGGGPAGMPMVRDRMAKILGHDPEVGFEMSGVVKDNDVFLRVLAEFGLAAPTLVAAGAAQKAAVAEGFGDKDPAALISHAYHSA